MKIEITLCLSNDDFNLEDVTKKLGIIPTSTRRKDEFPPQSIAAGVAATIWELEVEEKNCEAISIVFDKLINILKGKETIINALCKEYNLEVFFVVVVHTKENEGPELVLTRENIEFASSINAEIGFDLYYNEHDTYID